MNIKELESIKEKHLKELLFRYNKTGYIVWENMHF